MLTHNTLIQLKRWIGNNPQVADFRSGKEVTKKIKAEIGLEVTIKDIFDLIFPDRVYHCPNATFVGWAVGYRCDKTCECYKQRVSNSVRNTKRQYTAEQRRAIIQKRISTVQEKYCETNVFKLNSVKEKSCETKVNLYGDPKYRNTEKIKKTNLERYGVDNPLRNSDVLAKIKQTNVERYGVDNPLMSNEIREKIKQTNVERYGVDNAARNGEVQNKISNALRSLYLPKIEKKIFSSADQ